MRGVNAVAINKKRASDSKFIFVIYFLSDGFINKIIAYNAATMTLNLTPRKMRTFGYGFIYFIIGIALSLPCFFPTYESLGAQPLPRFATNPGFIVVHDIKGVNDEKPRTSLIRLKDNMPHVVDGDWNASLDVDGRQVVLYTETQSIFFSKEGTVQNITVGKNDQTVKDVLFSPDGNYLAIITEKGNDTNICTLKLNKLTGENPMCSWNRVPNGSPKILWHPEFDHALMIEMSEVLISTWFFDDRAPVNLDAGLPLGFAAAKKIFEGALNAEAEKITNRSEVFYGEFSIASTFKGIELTDRRTFQKSFVPFSTLGVKPSHSALPRVSLPQ